MVSRFMTAVEMRRWGVPAIVTLAVAALAALTADATARQVRPAPTTEATAPRDAGEPIMAIVSIKNQQSLSTTPMADPARAGVDRHRGTRDACWHLRRY